MKRHQMVAVFAVLLAGVHNVAALDATAIGDAAETEASVESDGVVRISWSRDDVAVTVDGAPFPPAAGMGSWAAFKETGEAAMVMGDTVVFQDEVDAAMDAAFAHDLEITALHNHFFYDEPKVYFMHISGQGQPEDLASGVKAVWDGIKEVRGASAEPTTSFGVPPRTHGGKITAAQIEEITGLKATDQPEGVIKISQGREGKMHGVTVGGTMGLSTWAAFVGSDELASMDGDFIMTADEVQPVLRALRRSGIHIVALHNHMTGEESAFYFTHFWGTGSVAELAKAFKNALDAQAAHAQNVTDRD